MNILQNFKAGVLAAHTPNHLILENCVGKVRIIVSGSAIEAGFDRYSHNGRLTVDFQEVLKMVYTKHANNDYQDPFDYSADELYFFASNYHWASVTVTLTDSEDPVPNQVQFGVKIVCVVVVEVREEERFSVRVIECAPI